MVSAPATRKIQNSTLAKSGECSSVSDSSGTM